MHTSSKKGRDGWPKGVFREILSCSKNELAPFGTVFIFKPQNFDEQKLGVVFGVIKVDDISEDSSYVVNLLTSVIKKEYFGKLNRSSEESFEACMRKANLALAELARHGSFGWSEKLNFACGALEKNNLHFACLGNVSVYLLRDGQIAEISRDIEEEKISEPHPLKTFSNISSGKLEKGDKLILNTGDLNEIFSPDELRQNARLFSLKEFPEFLEISLRANSELSGVIVLDFIDEPKPKVSLAEAPLIGKEKIKRIDSFIGLPEEEKLADKETFSPEAEGGESLWQKTLSFLKKSFALFAEKMRGLFSKIFYFFRSSSSRQIVQKINLRKPWLAAQSSGRKIRHGYARTLDRFRELEPKKKTYFIWTLMGIAVLLAVSLTILFYRSRKSAVTPPPAENISAETEPALALDDTEARKIDAIEKSAALPAGSTRIARLDNSLYAISEKNKSIIKINSDSDNIEEIKSNLSTGNFQFIAAMPDLKALFIFTEDKKIVSFTPINKNFQENGISLSENTNIRDIRSYLTYLYILDIANNQVYRYPRAEGGFGERQAWLRNTPDLKNANSIAINDDLYIAERNSIVAYLQGKKDEKINFEQPRTSLLIDRIYSEPDMDFVYVLDNKNHRVIRYTKDGKISVQYLSEEISEIKDISVDEKNKRIYLLTDNQLLKLSAD